MANLPHYVKFFRGTKAAWETILRPNEDTLYFIYSDDDATKGKLYLGSKNIGSVGEDTTIDELANIDIGGVPLGTGQILVYDAETGKWKNSSIADAFNISIGPMSGATSRQAGTTGLVPAPQAGDQNKFLKGDGTWATAPIKPYIFDEGIFVDSLDDAITLQGFGTAPIGAVATKGIFDTLTWTPIKTDALESRISTLQDVQDLINTDSPLAQDTIFFIPQENPFSENYQYDKVMVVNNQIEFMSPSINQLNQFITNEQIGDLSALQHCHGEDSTLVDEVNMLNEIVSWQDL